MITVERFDPKYTILPDSITIALSPVAVEEKEESKNVGNLDSQILDLFLNNKNISQPQIAENHKINSKRVERRMKKMKEKGIIERVGNKRKGYWIINNSNET